MARPTRHGRPRRWPPALFFRRIAVGLRPSMWPALVKLPTNARPSPHTFPDAPRCLIARHEVPRRQSSARAGGCHHWPSLNGSRPPSIRVGVSPNTLSTMRPRARRGSRWRERPLLWIGYRSGPLAQRRAARPARAVSAESRRDDNLVVGLRWHGTRRAPRGA